MEPRDDDFYIGYRRRAPAALARFLRGASALLLVLAAAVAALLASGQKRFGPGVFEYGTERELTGMIAERPVPLLVVPRPGGLSGADLRRDAPADDDVSGVRLPRAAAGASRYPLVLRGKHGAAEAVAGLDGALARAAGTLIYRAGTTMIELAAGSPARVPIGAARFGAGDPAGGAQDLGVRTLRGEIVDAKCWLGVMKPNRRRAHRACAALCLRGGIPAALVVDLEGGGEAMFLLVDAAGAALGERVLDLVAEPVEVRGRVTHHGDLLVLAADPAAIRRLR